MDWRRSCSTGFMQVERPSEGQYTMPITWFFAPPGAKTFYGINAFTSGIWDRDKPCLPPQLGEQPPYERPYYNGANVWGYIGQCRLGTDQQFAEGLSAADLLAPIKPIPGCCAPVEIDQAVAGLLLSSRSTQEQTITDVAGLLLVGTAAPRKHDQFYAGLLLSGQTSEHVVNQFVAGLLLSGQTSERVVYWFVAGILLSAITKSSKTDQFIAGLLLSASTKEEQTIADVAGLLLSASTQQEQTIADVAGLLLSADGAWLPPSVSYNGMVIITGPKIFLALPGPYPGVVAGVNVSGPGVPPGATVLSLVANIVNISAPAIATTSGTYLFF